MERISGVSNWRLVIRRDSAGITILHASTCDSAATLPDELLGAAGEMLDRCNIYKK